MDIGRKLREYEKFIGIKAKEYAATADEIEDFQQVGREAVWRAATKDNDSSRPKPHQYYRTAVKNACLNHSQRVQHKPNGAYIQNGEVKTLAYQQQDSANQLNGGVLWGDNPDLD